MSGASLLDVKFHKTHFTNVNWSMVELGGTHLETMDLSRVSGLTTCRHTRPSKIDYSPIKRSRLPFSFLRGVGIPDAELKNLPVELFDQALARSLTEAAEARKFFRKTFEQLTAERDVQKRGYLLERFLKDFFAFEGMTPRGSFRLLGEQIDGSFVWAERVFLLEAKWVKDPIGAAALSSLMYKIEGKTVDTRGLFISINGYSADALAGLKGKGALRFVCLDGTHLKACFERAWPWPKLLDHTWRYASETGEPYLPLVALTT
jgi:hypothetical protein